MKNLISICKIVLVTISTLMLTFAVSYGQQPEFDPVKAFTGGNWRYTCQIRVNESHNMVDTRGGTLPSSRFTYEYIESSNTYGGGTITHGVSGLLVIGKLSGLSSEYLSDQMEYWTDGELTGMWREWDDCNWVFSGEPSETVLGNGFKLFRPPSTSDPDWILIPIVTGSGSGTCVIGDEVGSEVIEDNSPPIRGRGQFRLPLEPNTNLQYSYVHPDGVTHSISAHLTLNALGLPIVTVSLNEIGAGSIRTDYIGITIEETYSYNNEFTYVFERLPDDLELIDPHADINNPRDFASQADTWATSEKTVEGITADGTTMLVLRMPVEEVEWAEISLYADDGLDGGVGTLLDLTGNIETTQLGVAPETTADGDFILALYRAPTTFVRDFSVPLDYSRSERWAKFRIDLELTSGATFAVEDSIKIVRPPVVLMHGLFGDIYTFSDDYAETLEDGDKRVVVQWSYEPTNHLPFAANIDEPRDAIEFANNELRAMGVASTKVDVVGHSMGALLTRLYTQNNSLYIRPDNFGEGDVNRLISVNSPHFGTPLADVIHHMASLCNDITACCAETECYNTVRNRCDACKVLYWFQQFMFKKPNAFSGGAVSDLRTGGTAITEFVSFGEPSHAVFGSLDPEVDKATAIEFALWTTIRTLFPVFASTPLPQTLSELMCGSHDGIVPYESQLGGMGGEQTTSLGTDVLHTDAVSTSERASPVDQLLDFPKNDPTYFGSFSGWNPALACPPPDFDAASAPASKYVPSTALAGGDYSVEIIAPTNNGTVRPGDTVVVDVQVVNGDGTDEVVVIADGIDQVVGSAPYSGSWRIPDEAIGSVQLFAFASNESGNFAVSQLISLSVEVNASLIAINAVPSSVYLDGPNAVRKPALVGEFDDGVPRSLSPEYFDLVFTVDDTAIATVNSDGWIVGAGVGEAVMTVSSGPVSQDVRVIVKSDTPLPVADITPPVISFDGTCPDTVCKGSGVFLTLQVSDEESGIQFQSTPNGSYLLNTNTVGNHLFYVSASDSAANSTSLACSYTVVSCCDSGSIAGLVLSNSLGLVGVPIGLYDSAGVLIGAVASNDSGRYLFDSLAPGNYTVTISTPLGFTSTNESQVVEVCEPVDSVNFVLEVQTVVPDQRSRGYWMHQVNALLTGHGNAQETMAGMCNYLELIRLHFNEHSLNAVNVFEVDLTADCDARLEAAREVISPRPHSSMVDKAKSHFTALLFNMVSGKIHQLSTVSEDSATLSQAITYCNDLIESGDEGLALLARDISETINNGMVVPAGWIDNATPQILYRQDTDLPTEFRLGQNYPNPFNPSTEIRFALPVAGHVRLAVYNILGQNVRTLVDGWRSAGYHSVSWNASSLASGVYLYRIEAAGYIETKKMLLVR